VISRPNITYYYVGFAGEKLEREEVLDVTIEMAFNLIEELEFRAFMGQKLEASGSAPNQIVSTGDLTTLMASPENQKKVEAAKVLYESYKFRMEPILQHNATSELERLLVESVLKLPTHRRRNRIQNELSVLRSKSGTEFVWWCPNLWLLASKR
jgi:hypothetical protein